MAMFCTGGIRCEKASSFMKLNGFYDDKQQGQSQLVSVVDLAHVSGPGGNYYSNWVYGDDRPALVVSVRKQGNDYFCVFDNGNVLVHDANFEEDLNDKSGLIVGQTDIKVGVMDMVLIGTKNRSPSHKS